MTDTLINNIIRRCNELAMRSRGQTGTNPNVGAVILDQDSGRILGEGWHQTFGKAHAEINAINNVPQNIALAHHTIAVSLEPCNHTGKTPPCTSAILKHHLDKVVIDQQDPHPSMTGRSVKLLRQSGVNLPAPLDTSTGKRVLEPFSISQRFHRPFLRLKMAISQDNFIGQTGRQIPITNPLSQRWVHRLRNETQAIMAGTQTILNDNPALTSRFGNLHQPIRILPDRRGILSDHLRVFSEPGENIILTLSNRNTYRGKIIKLDPLDLKSTFRYLYDKCHIGSILIEGGRRLFTSLFQAGMWDELIIFQNTELKLNSGVEAPLFPALPADFETKLGSDTINFINNPHPR